MALILMALTLQLLRSNLAGPIWLLSMPFSLLNYVSQILLHLFAGRYLDALLDITLAAFVIWFLFFRGPPKKRLAKKLIGEKSRALVEKLVQSLQPVKQPAFNPI